MQSDAKTRNIPVRLNDETIIYVQVEKLGGEEYTALELPDFENISATIQGIAQSLVTTMRKVKPRKGSVEFGLQVAVEAGKLTTLLVKGSGEASLKITLEWGEELAKESAS